LADSRLPLLKTSRSFCCEIVQVHHDLYIHGFIVGIGELPIVRDAEALQHVPERIIRSPNQPLCQISGENGAEQSTS